MVMIKRLDKYETLLEFLNIVAPKPYFVDLQMAECDWVVHNVKKAAAGQELGDTSISPESLAFVKTQSKAIYKNLAKFLENLKDAEFYNVEENKYFEIVRTEFTGFMSLFNRNTDPDVVKYCKVVSDAYALLK